MTHERERKKDKEKKKESDFFKPKRAARFPNKSRGQASK